MRSLMMRRGSMRLLFVLVVASLAGAAFADAPTLDTTLATAATSIQSNVLIAFGAVVPVVALCLGIGFGFRFLKRGTKSV